MTKEQAFNQFVEAYDIEVPEERIDNEYQYFLLQTKHNMQYDTLTTGRSHLRRGQELAEMEDELRARARLEAKTDLVMKQLLKELNPNVTEEELQARAQEISKKEGTPIDMLKLFFGQDFEGLKRDLQEEKVKEYVWKQLS